MNNNNSVLFSSFDAGRYELYCGWSMYKIPQVEDSVALDSIYPDDFCILFLTCPFAGFGAWAIHVFTHLSID